MKKILLVAAVVLILTGQAVWADDSQWNFKVEPIWMDVYGNDVHVGDIFKYKQTFFEDSLGGWKIKYGTEYEPIVLGMRSNLALRFELNYQNRNNWGLNFSGWGFWPGAWQSGNVTSPAMEGIPGGYIGYIYGVRMWDHSIVPVTNELQNSGFSPVDWWATNKLGVYTVDLLVSNALGNRREELWHDVVSGPEWDIIWGAKAGVISNERWEKQAQRAYITYTAPFWVIYDNHISLESKSRVDYHLLVGPTVGLRVKAHLTKYRLEAFLKQSLLMGEVQSSGTWLDVDDIVWRDYWTKEFIFEDIYSGRFTFAQPEKVAIPVTEFKANFSCELSKKFSLGLGGFGSIWCGAPLAPKWSVPGDWTSMNGTGWQCQKSTLIFYGTSLSIIFKF